MKHNKLTRTQDKNKKPSILRVLITFDVGIIAAIFIILIIFFNSSIAALLFDTAADSMRARSGQIINELQESYDYIKSKPEIDTEDVYQKIYRNVIDHALNELEYDNSLAVLFNNETELVGGTRIARNAISDIDNLSNFTDESRTLRPLSLPELEETLSGLEGNVLLVRFKYSGSDYIGTAQLMETADEKTLLLLADRVNDFFSQLYNIRNIFLLLIGSVLVLLLFVKILNTRAAAGEILHIRDQLQKQGDAIQRDGIVGNIEGSDEYEFMDTNDLAGSFYYLNSRIENLGTIIEGIADKDLFIAALRDDKSVLTPHEENMAILFLDVQGFTSISEQFGSGAMNIINRIWDMVQTAVEGNGGKTNKFMGDACLVIFPEMETETSSSSLRALKSTVRLYRDIADLCVELQIDVAFRVGLDYGPVVYGKTGSEKKYELGVIGDPVNTASRFENLNKQYGTRLLISGEIVENAGFNPKEKALSPLFDNFFLFRIDTARPKGKKQPKIIYSLMVSDGKKQNKYSLIGLNHFYHYKLLEMHNVFLEAYKQNISFWREGETDRGGRVWGKLAYSWAVMHKKYEFSVAGIFIERFITAENYLAYRKAPQEWIDNRRISVMPPDEKWIETGYYELEK